MDVRPIVSLEGTTGGGIVTPPPDTTDIDDTLLSLPDGDEKGTKKSQAKKALAIMEEHCSELFLDQFGSLCSRKDWRTYRNSSIEIF